MKTSTRLMFFLLFFRCCSMRNIVHILALDCWKSSKKWKWEYNLMSCSTLGHQQNHSYNEWLQNMKNEIHEFVLLPKQGHVLAYSSALAVAMQFHVRRSDLFITLGHTPHCIILRYGRSNLIRWHSHCKLTIPCEIQHQTHLIGTRNCLFCVATN